MSDQQALAHYRERAAEHRAVAAQWRVPGLTDPRAEEHAAKADVRAALWDALADELEAFGEQQTEHHDGQGELL